MATKKTANKSPSKRAPSKKSSPGKKSSASKKSSTESSSSQATSDGSPGRRSTSRSRSGGSAPRASAPKRPTALQVASEAARQLLELTGREAEGITGVERTDDGWQVQVEVVEVHRIPNTTDVLAVYELEVDEDGDVQGYRRLRRYARGVPGEN
jgi:hypothetical protein